MDGKDIIDWTKNAIDEQGKLNREVIRRMMNVQPHRARWQFQGGSSGGGHTIWFTIDAVLCVGVDDVDRTTLVVQATRYTQCNKTPPGANCDGTYNVVDDCGYLLGLVAEDLIGTTGRATYFYGVDDYGAGCVGEWVLSDLCATPECA